jgi:hypothetical protein
MGHDLPRDLWPTFANAIDHNAARSRRPAAYAAAVRAEHSTDEPGATAEPKSTADEPRHA